MSSTTSTTFPFPFLDPQLLKLFFPLKRSPYLALSLHLTLLWAILTSLRRSARLSRPANTPARVQGALFSWRRTREMESQPFHQGPLKNLLTRWPLCPPRLLLICVANTRLLPPRAESLRLEGGSSGAFHESRFASSSVGDNRGRIITLLCKCLQDCLICIIIIIFLTYMK